MTSTDFAGQEPDRADSGATPKEMARQAVQAVRNEAQSFADSAKGLASERVERGRQTAGKTMGDFASAIRKAGDELAGREQNMAGQVVRKAADGLENVSRSIADKQPDEMLDTVRDFARQNPAAFIAGSVLLGIAIGRFAKSSQSRMEEERSFQRYGADSRYDAGTMAEEPGAPSASAYPMADGQTSGLGADLASPRDGLNPDRTGSEF